MLFENRLICNGQANLQQASQAKQVILETAVTLGVDPDAPMLLAVLDNEIAEDNYQQYNEVPIEMTDSEKTQYNNEWRTYREQNMQLSKHSMGQAFSLILGQCMHLAASGQNETRYQLECSEQFL
jgi:predicted glycosyl hydrolase (DUF1957 family)